MPNYTEMVIAIREEIERLVRSQEFVQRRIEHLQSAHKALELLAQETEGPILEPPPMPPDVEQGFTDQVRSIFKANPIRAFSAVDIRDTLLGRDPHADPKILLIHSHNTLKRLLRQDEIVGGPVVEGRNTYKLRMKPVIDMVAALRESLSKTQKFTEEVERLRKEAVTKRTNN